MAFVTSPRLTSDGLNDLRSLTYVAGVIITGVADFLQPLTFSQNNQTSNNTPPPMLRDSTGMNIIRGPPVLKATFKTLVPFSSFFLCVIIGNWVSKNLPEGSRNQIE